MSRQSYYFIFIALFSVVINGSVSAKTTPSRALGIMARSSCRRKCGGITFEYPFGIGSKGCYLNEWYEVVCNKSSSVKEVSFLPKIKREVVNFSISGDSGITYGLVHVKSPVISSGCSEDQGPKSPLDVTNSPFFISDTNHLVAVCCNTKAMITGIKSQVAGCESTCDEEDRGRNEICSGYRCCQARLPIDLPQVIDVTMESGGGGGGVCRVAFLTNDTYSSSNITEPEAIHVNGYSVVELGWYFDTSDPRDAC